ncbi:hypothetical protein IFR05_010146 [Cadophora sp. M221]|nr:hypothetical protein IFR05_010146 [Cadophora sp. M221]
MPAAPQSGYPPSLTSSSKHTSRPSLSTTRLRSDIASESTPRAARPQEFRAAPPSRCPAGRGEALALPPPLLPGPEHRAGCVVGVAMCAYVYGGAAAGGELLNYTPQATLVRLLTINSMNAYITSWVLYLSGGSEDPRLLLPAWISIASTLTFLYHLTHPRLAILKETSLSISVFSIASFISMVSLLLQLHLTRENDPPVPLFGIVRVCWEYFKIGVGMLGMVGRESFQGNEHKCEFRLKICMQNEQQHESVEKATDRQPEDLQFSISFLA